VSFAAITLCVASQWVFTVLSIYFTTESFGYTLVSAFQGSQVYKIDLPHHLASHTIKYSKAKRRRTSRNVQHELFGQ
jgi:hypothetical protein